jgi:hypothetical protein
MKTKHLLYITIIVGLLATIGAIPVLADETVMWVHRVRLAYTGRSSTGPDAMNALVHIRDENLTMVEGATVTAEWTLPNGTLITGEEAVTNLQGIAIFETFAGAGSYTFCVTGVAKAGWDYKEELNRETCTTFILPPY